MMNKINRRDFLKLLGIGAGAVAAGSAWIKPLPVDMSKQGREDEVQEVEQAMGGEMVTGGFSTRKWVHPCEGKAEPDDECKNCNYYFCPPGYRARLWAKLYER